MIYFDLDGVLRDLCSIARIKPRQYSTTVYGEEFVSYFSKRTHLLTLAPETEYFEVAITLHKYIAPITIISHQPDIWKRATEQWLIQHFKQFMPNVIYESDKLKHLKYNDILIEDNPFLADYRQVLLIDRTYNKKVKNVTRIKSPTQLFQEIHWRIYDK